MIRFHLSGTQTDLVHYFLSGFGVAVAASLTGITASSVISVGTLVHAVEVAAIVALGETIVRATSQPSTGASGSTPAAPNP